MIEDLRKPALEVQLCQRSEENWDETLRALKAREILIYKLTKMKFVGKLRAVEER